MTAPATDIAVESTKPAAPSAVSKAEKERAPGKTTIADVSATRTSKGDAVLHTYKRSPGEIVRGEGVYLYDAEGNRYLDFVSGIAVNALGYADPGLTQALHMAADGLVHVSNLYETSPATRLATALVE